MAKSNETVFDLHRPPMTLPLTQVAYEADLARISVGYCEDYVDTYLLVAEKDFPQLLGALRTLPAAKGFIKRSTAPEPAIILQLFVKIFAAEPGADSPYAAIQRLFDQENVPYTVFRWVDSDHY
ncbi:MAG: hypothetical protein KBA75_08570 [Alphaproteobacteria bacterium]|nr:hypothetical protein [Alphaproteobacteria bacterium]